MEFIIESIKTQIANREIYQSCVNKTFAEYIDWEIHQKSEIASMAYEHFFDGWSPAKIDLYFQCQYLWFCVNDLVLAKPFIEKTWGKYIDIIPELSITDIVGDTELLLKITMAAEYDILQIKKFLGTLFFAVVKKFYHDLSQEETDFKYLFDELFKWYDFRLEIEKTYCVNYVEQDMSMLQQVYYKYQSAPNYVRNNPDRNFLEFTGCVYKLYPFMEMDRRYKYIQFFKEIMLERIVALKACGAFDYMSETIIHYEEQRSLSESNKTKRIFSNLIGFFTGYGEKPERLAIFFIILQVLFTLIYFVSPLCGSDIFVLHGINNLHWYNKLINIVYFNNTTMLTIGYGDIYPDNTITKLLVMVEQILGFIVAGGFVTLYLRKLFRF